MPKKRMNLKEFISKFKKSPWKDYFSEKGLSLLYEVLQNLEMWDGTEQDLNIVEIVTWFDEFNDVYDFINKYFNHEPGTFIYLNGEGQNGTSEYYEEYLKKGVEGFLLDNVSLFKFADDLNGGFIIKHNEHSVRNGFKTHS